MSALKKTWGWYRSRPLWGKILLALPIVLLLVGIAVLFVMTAGRLGSGARGSDPVKTALDLREGMIEDELERTRGKDKKLRAEVKAFEREIDELEVKARKRAETRREEHAEINGADNVADVDRALYGRDSGG